MNDVTLRFFFFDIMELGKRYFEEKRAQGMTDEEIRQTLDSSFSDHSWCMFRKALGLKVADIDQ